MADVEAAASTSAAAQAEAASSSLAAPPQASTSASPAPPADGDDPSATSTVYIKNLNEKVKLDILKTSLNSLFSVYGHVLGITAHGNLRMRGQAFVAFDDVEVAKKAVKEVNGFPLYGKAMQLSFARTPSDAVVLHKTSNDSDSPQFQSHKSERLRRKEERKAADAAANAANAGQKRKQPEGGVSSVDGASSKKATSGGGAGGAAALPDEYLPPNPILFIQNLPAAGVTREVLEPLFAAYEGLQDVRMIPGRNVAFVEYANEGFAARAKDGLNGRKIEGQGEEERGIKITFTRAQ